MGKANETFKTPLDLVSLLASFSHVTETLASPSIDRTLVLSLCGTFFHLIREDNLLKCTWWCNSSPCTWWNSFQSLSLITWFNPGTAFLESISSIERHIPSSRSPLIDQILPIHCCSLLPTLFSYWFWVG